MSLPTSSAFGLMALEDRLVDACGVAQPCVADNGPTVSGGSNLDSVDMVVLGAGAQSGAAAEAGPATDAGAAAADEVSVEAPAAESDNDDGADDVPAPKFRKLICSEPPPAVKASIAPEVLAAMTARGTEFLPGAAGPAVEAFIRKTIEKEQAEDNFYVYNLATVERLYGAWARLMPRVHPCYAVKCNPDDGLLATLAALGAGFDCASEAEIAQVLALGVAPERIVYAHPCKPPRQVRWAAAHGVNLTTFDTESELAKMAQWHPGSGLLLRIRADDPAARCQLGNKYGAELASVPRLLEAAAGLGLAVRGVSFHVGSGAKNPAAFTAAIEAARHVFDLGLAMGHAGMDTLDLGGGFCGGDFDAAGEVDLGGVPAAINAALDLHFPDPEGKLRIIAEPGRYFAEAFATYATHVNGWRERAGELGERLFDYYITDGLYGAMNCMVYDHAELAPVGMRSPLLPPVAPAEDAALFKTTLFGPTCDGLDTVARDVPMPRLRTGDWVLFPRFGAYTVAGAVDFNGFKISEAKVHYVYAN